MTKESTRFARLARLATGSIDTKKNSAGVNWDRVYPNLKFRLTSTKPKGWIGIWHKPQAFSKKLIDKKQIAIVREKCC